MTTLQKLINQLISDKLISKAKAKELVLEEKEDLKRLAMDCYLDGAHYGKVSNEALRIYSDNYIENL